MCQYLGNMSNINYVFFFMRLSALRIVIYRKPLYPYYLSSAEDP